MSLRIEQSMVRWEHIRLTHVGKVNIKPCALSTNGTYQILCDGSERSLWCGEYEWGGQAQERVTTKREEQGKFDWQGREVITGDSPFPFWSELREECSKLFYIQCLGAQDIWELRSSGSSGARKLWCVSIGAASGLWHTMGFRHMLGFANTSALTCGWG